MNKKVTRGEETRAQIVTVATRLFAERGYEGTSIEAVLHESEMSRGSLYHHFGGKQALFEAVLEAVETDTGRRTVAATREAADPMAALREGCLAWVRLAADPVVQQIVLIDAPSVLGWHRWRQVEERHAFGLLKNAVEAVAATGRLQPDLVDTFAHMLLASINEVALLIAAAEDVDAATRTAQAAVDELLSRLLDA